MQRQLQKLAKWLVILAFGFSLLVAMSYAGARVTAGKILGQNPPVAGRSIMFAFEGVDWLPGKPRAWIVTYSSTQLPRVPTVQIYVSPTGRLIATWPENLDQRLEAYERSREP